MPKPIQISIPTPCHENWQAMTPSEKGRFCAACQKQVYDFTKSTDIEIADALKNDKNLCGRFKSHQLERNLIVPKQKKSLWMAASFTALLSLITNAASAQEKARTEQHEKIDYPPVPGDAVQTGSENIVSGTVRDLVGALPGASILNMSTKQAVISDFDGKFEIKASQGDTLSVAYISFITASIVIQEKSHYDIVLEEAALNGMITDVYGEPFRNRTFFGRIIYNIRNWFR